MQVSVHQRITFFSSWLSLTLSLWLYSSEALSRPSLWPRLQRDTLPESLMHPAWFIAVDLYRRTHWYLGSLASWCCAVTTTLPAMKPINLGFVPLWPWRSSFSRSIIIIILSSVEEKTSTNATLLTCLCVGMFCFVLFPFYWFFVHPCLSLFLSLSLSLSRWMNGFCVLFNPPLCTSVKTSFCWSGMVHSQAPGINYTHLHQIL